MREAMKYGAADSARWLPMIELAKQSYRTLLRERPSEWDARYNLELALRLAPELESMSWTGVDLRPDSERTTSTIPQSRNELPCNSFVYLHRYGSLGQSHSTHHLTYQPLR